MFLPHSCLACAAVVADILARTRSVFIDHNLAGVGGYTQSLQLIQVIQERTLERDSVTDGQCAVQQFASKPKNFRFLGIPL